MGLNSCYSELLMGFHLSILYAILALLDLFILKIRL